MNKTPTQTPYFTNQSRVLEAPMLPPWSHPLLPPGGGGGGNQSPKLWCNIPLLLFFFFNSCTITAAWILKYSVFPGSDLYIKESNSKYPLVTCFFHSALFLRLTHASAAVGRILSLPRCLTVQTHNSHNHSIADGLFSLVLTLQLWTALPWTFSCMSPGHVYKSFSKG